MRYNLPKGDLESVGESAMRGMRPGEKHDDLPASNSRQVDRDNLINDPEIVSTISCQGRATWSDPPDPRCIRRCENDERRWWRKGIEGGRRRED